MIQENTKREQFLLMLFPAALVLAIYSVVFAVPMRQDHAKLESEFQREESTAVSATDAEFSAQQLATEKESLLKLQNRVTESKLKIRELSTQWRSASSRLETLEKITELMRDYNLSIVSQGSDESVAVSGYLTELFEKMNEQSVLDPVEFWPVEVKGAYFDMLEFLADVNLLAKNSIPISITMQPEAEGSRQLTWTIVFVN
ncbi:MAG: hypothetical protein AAFN77_17775 [Planctomycetota bacterium]